MKKTTIAICDDDRLYSDKLERLIISFAQKTGHAFRVFKFFSGEALLHSKVAFRILFLDANLPGLDGVETAWQMRRRNPDFLLVFVSAHMEYAPLGYEVRAFRYLLKSQLDIALERCMTAALHTLGLTRPCLRLPFVGGEDTVFADEIIFVESQKHVARFHLAVPHRKLHIYETLDNLAQALPDGQFTRIHKSYLVNLQYLDNAVNYTAFLSTGRTLPISQKKFGAAKRDFIQYKGKL